jgi:hypothetical protein
MPIFYLIDHLDLVEVQQAVFAVWTLEIGKLVHSVRTNSYITPTHGKLATGKTHILKRDNIGTQCNRDDKSSISLIGNAAHEGFQHDICFNG